MTVIAYKAGIMAADSQIQAGGLITGTGKKIVKTKDSFLLGAAGEFASMNMFFDWFQDEDENRPPLSALKLEGLAAMIVSPGGDIVHIDSSGYPMEIDAPFYALGIGADIAIGALEVGASPQDAVRAAIKWSSGCGGKVQVVKL